MICTGKPEPRFNSGETLDLGKLPQYWEHLDQLEQRVQQVDAPTRLITQRARDEAQPAGARTYFAARRAISIGCESLHNLRIILHAGEVTPIAPMFLLRPMLESGFHATYILEPAESATRRCRGLAREIYDGLQGDIWLNEYDAIIGDKLNSETRARRKADVRAIYTKEAESLGTTYDQLRKNKVNVIDEIKRLDSLRRHEPVVRQQIAGAWRFLSGCDHGLVYPVSMGGQAISTKKIPGGTHSAIVMNDETFGLMAQSASLMLLEAMNLYIDRSTQTT